MCYGFSRILRASPDVHLGDPGSAPGRDRYTERMLYRHDVFGKSAPEAPAALS